MAAGSPCSDQRLWCFAVSISRPTMLSASQGTHNMRICKESVNRMCWVSQGHGADSSAARTRLIYRDDASTPADLMNWTSAKLILIINTSITGRSRPNQRSLPLAASLLRWIPGGSSLGLPRKATLTGM
jgi:hypothetical protein